MSEDRSYLKYLINEQIYLIQEEYVTANMDGVKEATGDYDAASESTKTNVARINQPKKATTADEVITTPINNNQPKPTHRLLVVYDHEGSEALPVPLKKLMLKIVAAVGIDVMTGVYVNVCFRPVPDQLIDFENILVFGNNIELDLSGYHMDNKYVLQEINHVRVLVADQLALLETEIPLKRQLWAELQRMFPKD